VRTGGERRLGDYLGGEVREDGGSGGGVSTGLHPRCSAEFVTQPRRPPGAERTGAKAKAAQEEEQRRGWP